jgi:radical SAM superfamily enzyme YgiQ (UPF0313 family)
MTIPVKSVLYIRLPVWKIYPGGVIYVADFIHKQRPDIHQELLDMALIPKGQRRAVLRRKLKEMQPDVVAFSWRNMQTFGPHPENDALDVVMNYDYSPKPWRRLKAAWDAVGIIWDYASARLNNFGFMKLVRSLLPEARIVVGGTAVSIFGKYITQHVPNNTVVVVGEGEEAMLSIVDGFTAPAGHHYFRDAQGRISHHPAEETFDLGRLTAVDFDYVQQLFPGFKEYLGETIGVHTKRGCPFQCHFCLYNKIEGARQRFRAPEEVVKEIEGLTRLGVKHIWFTDAQFCSTKRSTDHVEQILDLMIARQVKVTWSGYLRLNHLSLEVARKMLDSGIASIDLSFTGSQDIVDSLTLGYDLQQQMAAFKLFQEAGLTTQKVKLYMPLNAPGETVATLQATIDRIKELYAMFGRDQVLPFIFFIGVQPNTPVEKLLLSQGYLKEGYNPLSLWPFTIKRLLYNPEPFGSVIGRAYLEAMDSLDAKSDYIGRATMEILEGKLAEMRDAEDCTWICEMMRGFAQQLCPWCNPHKS